MTHLAEPIDVSPTAAASQLIHAALQWAAPDTHDVLIHEDLNGASIIGPEVEAYVYACDGDLYQVDVWRRSEYATEAVRTWHTANLYTAIELAITSTIGLPQA